MSEQPKLAEIPRAPKIDEEFADHIAELHRVGRTENFAGMINIIFTDADEVIITPHLGDVEMPMVLYAIREIKKRLDDWYEE